MGSVKVYRSRIVTIRGFASLSVIVTSDRVIRLSLPSGVSDYRSVNRLLSLTLYLSLVESVIDTYYELDILGELTRAIYSGDFVLDFLLKTLVKLGDIGVIVLIEFKDDLSESRGVYGG